MTPLTRRRLALFRAHRRGFWSLWIFLVLFVFCAAAEFVANDRPLVIYYQDRWFFPVLQDYSGDDFGPDFLPIGADYGDPQLVPVRSIFFESNGQPGRALAQSPTMA